MKQSARTEIGFGPSWIALPTTRRLIFIPGPVSRYVEESLPTQVGRPLDSAVGHLLSHVEQEPTVAFFNSTHQPAELAQKTSLFSGTAPNDIVSAFALGKVGESGRFFSVVKELVEWDFESASHLFQCFNGWNSMAVFHARNITA